MANRGEHEPTPRPESTAAFKARGPGALRVKALPIAEQFDITTEKLAELLLSRGWTPCPAESAELSKIALALRLSYPHVIDSEIEQSWRMRFRSVDDPLSIRAASSTRGVLSR